MALRVWLPLNGNLENKGLSNCAIVNSGATVNNSGKIGQCYEFNGDNNFISVDYPQSFNEKWTYCCWIYNDDVGGRSIFYGDFSLPNTGNISIEKTTAEKVRFYWNNGNPDVTFNNSIITTSTWTHLALTYDGTVVSCYINGVLTDTRSGALTPVTKTGLYYIGRDGRTGGTAFKGKMNDFRIYDECLSQKQIKEISKGLVAHYKLDEPRALNNIIRGATYGVYNNFYNTGTTGSLTKLDERYNGCDIYRLTMTPNETSVSNFQTNLYSHGIMGFRNTFKANTKYCFWVLWRPVTHNDVTVGGIASNIGGWTEIPSQKWGDGWYIVGQKRGGGVAEDKTDNIFVSFKTPTAEAGVPISIDFCCPHLVEGIDYIEPEFDYIGTNISYEADCSGNGYNGIISGVLKYNIDSSRYSGSTNFSTPGYIHYLPSPINTSTDAFTFTCWFYPTQNATMALYNDRTAVGDGFSVFYLGGGIRFDTGASAQFQSGTITVNAWNFIACVFDKNNNIKKTYINGTQTGSTSTIGSLANVGVNASIGNSSTNGAAGAGNQIYGSLSDIRIYATALSVDDIKQLYQVPAMIDNQGNAYAYEFKEE